MKTCYAVCTVNLNADYEPVEGGYDLGYFDTYEEAYDEFERQESNFYLIPENEPYFALRIEKVNVDEKGNVECVDVPHEWILSREDFEI